MRYLEVTHPYLAHLNIDPVLLQRLRGFAEDGGGEFVLGAVDRSTPDLWRVTLHCASKAVAARMKEGWG
jgi:hypothetical protein